MDGISFFDAHLPTITMPYPRIGEGVCAIHNRPAVVYDANGTPICRGCAVLRQGYPSNKGSSRTRMSLGCYMLITDSEVTYWGNHDLPPPVRVASAAGALRTLVRGLILTPPEPPWMFIAFARANNPERLRVTTSNDVFHFSGKFFLPGGNDDPPVERLNRHRVLALYEAAPTLTRREWEACATAYAGLSTSPAALAHLRAVFERYPALAQHPIPSLHTPEYHALRVLADDT